MYSTVTLQIALPCATGRSAMLCTMDGSRQVQDLVRVGVTDACEARGEWMDSTGVVRGGTRVKKERMAD
jgi:hypothetical protein